MPARTKGGEQNLFMMRLRAFFQKQKGNIVASDAFDDFVRDILPYAAELPVVDAEIGDTWIFGTSADSKKVALYRAASRAHAACVRSQSAAACASVNGEAAFHDFERLLMVMGEHTWGWNGGSTKTKSWSNKELNESLRSDKDFAAAVLSWTEQRKFLQHAVEALPEHSALRLEIEHAWKELTTPKQPVKKQIIARGSFRVTNCGAWSVGFAADGSLNHLVERNSGRVVADEAHPLFWLHYEGYDDNFFKKYVSEYIAGVSSVWPTLTAEGFFKTRAKSSCHQLKRLIGQRILRQKTLRRSYSNSVLIAPWPKRKEAPRHGHKLLSPAALKAALQA